MKWNILGTKRDRVEEMNDSQESSISANKLTVAVNLNNLQALLSSEVPKVFYKPDLLEEITRL